MEIIIHPDGHLLMDDELHIIIRGLHNGQCVTVYTVITDDGKDLESCCWFTANENGLVDIYNHAAIAGSYTGVSPMGIFWSMDFSPGVRKGTRLTKTNMDAPITAKLAVYSGHLAIEDIRTHPEIPVATQFIKRWYKGEGVTSCDVDDGRLRGKLYLPAGSGPFPAVLDIYGSSGGITEYRAALLASRGFVALALPYFKYKDLPTKLEDVDLDYFIEAVHWLRNHEAVRAPVGVISFSRGADIGYLLAANCEEVRFLVAINGLAFNAGFPIKYSRGDIPDLKVNYDDIKNEDGIFFCKKMFHYTEADLAPVWRYNPKVLNIISKDDDFIPSESVYHLKRCYPPDNVDNFEIISYPGAGHVLEPPYIPLVSLGYHKLLGGYVSFGGNPKDHAAAQEKSWRDILDFLHKNTNEPTQESRL